MPCLANQELLIQSNKMETSVFIQESQLSLEPAKTSKTMQEFRHSSRRLLLAFILLMVLLIGGAVGLGIWMSQTVSDPACTETFNKAYNLTDIPGKEQEYYVFTVPQNGTYLIYGKVEKGSPAIEKCEADEVRLIWERNGGELTIIKEANFMYQSNVEIAAIDVYLEEETEVHLQLNCANADKEKTVFRVWSIFR